jgi:methylphosphotriester-DNA--protein-cysteine methyltransferase
MEIHCTNTVKTRQEIAAEYGISPRTLRRWLKKHNIILPNRMLCPNEQKIVYNLLGSPNQIDP